MNNVFTSFLNKKDIYGPVLRDYQHASKLYVDSVYAMAPKFGFLYFIQLNIADNPRSDDNWKKRINEVGLLAKKVNLPSFKIDTETLNQYNRKTIVQTGIKYNNINIEFHDDMSNITHGLWVNYYKNFYRDSTQEPAAYNDNKFGERNYEYGIYNNKLSNNNFIDTIDIHVLYQQKFTKYTLVNPKIVEWKHDEVSQDAGPKILQNSMTVEYETVLYKEGKIWQDPKENGISENSWEPIYYDTEKSPFGNQDFGVNNVLYPPKANSKFDESIKRKKAPPRPQAPGMLAQLGGILLKNYVNQNALTRQKSVAYNIAGSVMSRSLDDGAGKYAEAPPTQNAPGVFGTPGGVGINIFKAVNTTVDGNLRVNPAAILFPPKN
jgi:hypothetical protein